MRFFMVLGVLMWVLIAVWLIRLGLGLDHPSEEQVPALVCGGIGGGLAGWFYVSRQARRLAAERRGD